MAGDDVMLSFRVPRAVDKQLDVLSIRLSRKKSELLREAAIALIGVYKNARRKE